MRLSITSIFALLPAVALAIPSLETLNQPIAPLIQARAPGKAIPGKYVVVFKDGTDDALDKAIGSYKAGYVYRSKGFKGFAGALDAASLANLRRLPEVDYIEEDAEFTAWAIVNQTNAPWNLARLSSRTPGSNVYRYDSTAGSGTCSYIIDTGILTTHPQFGTRAVWGTNTIDSSNADLNGHGTGIAGIIGATTLGVAKLTKLIAVKVLSANGSGTTSAVIAGMNWVATDHLTRGCPYGSVAAMAIGGSFSAAVNNAAKALVNSGVFLAVAAGGSNANVSNFSPASEPLACTAGASTASDSVASSSNYGSLLDIYAPGQNILTTWTGGGTNYLSGTSLAAAHIAGLGAYLLRVNPSLTELGLCEYMQKIATKDVLTGVPAGTKNLLAYNGWDL